MKNFRIVITALVVITALALPAASSALARPISRDGHGAKTKVGLAVLFSLNDSGFNSLAYKGLKLAMKDSHVQGHSVVAQSPADCVATLKTLVNDHYTFILAVGGLWDSAVYTVAAENPKLHFGLVDGEPQNNGKNSPLPNVASLFFHTEQAGYIVGVLSGLMEKHKVGIAKHNTIGMLGGGEFPIVLNEMCGYLEGARSVDSKVKVLSAFAGGQNGFDDPTQGTAIGEQQIQKNADILLGVANATDIGYYKAAKTGHKYAIGYASDQDKFGNQILTSALVNIQVAVSRIISAQVHGTFKGGAHYFTIANGGVGYATDNMHHVPKSIQSYVAAIARKIKSRKIIARANSSLCRQNSI